jgi:CBS domain-containing protein
MHPGVLTCNEDDSLRHVAAIMAYHHVHAVVITTSNPERPIGVVSDQDVIAAAALGAECAAREIAGTETLTIPPEEPLRTAVQLMIEHGVSHLVVVDSGGGYPVGVLSALDVATVYAGG